MSGSLNNLPIREGGGVGRDEVEKAMIRTATESGQGWNGTLAMVALALMFIARAISDVATAIKAHTIMVGRRQR